MRNAPLFVGPCPPYRWQLGLLLLGLPRRFIPRPVGGPWRSGAGGGTLPPPLDPLLLGQLLLGQVDEPLPYPVGHGAAVPVGGPLEQILLFFGEAKLKACGQGSLTHTDSVRK
jgi:hypothetical protein